MRKGTWTQRFYKVAFVGLLCGCGSSYREEFECTPGSGIGCKSISEVNQLVDKGQLSEPERAKAPLGIVAPPVLSFEEKDAIVRIPERTLHVLVRGYTDEQGHFHEDAKIHMVIREASWGKVQ